MGQFDIYRLDRSDNLFLELQSDVIADLPTRVGAPLILKPPLAKPVERLMPEFQVEDRLYIMMTHQILSVPARDLRNRVSNIQHEQYRIKTALDMLFFGF